MAEPKKRLTSARSGARRSHIRLKSLILSSCPKCQEAKLPHQVCPNCGFYRGVDFLRLEEKARQKEERRKAAAETENEPGGKEKSE